MSALDPLVGSLGLRRAAHLLRRSSLKLTKELIDDFALKNVEQAIDELVLTPPAYTLEEPIYYETGQPWINSGVDPGTNNSGFLRNHVVGWWINESIQACTVHYKMVLFLHNTFTTSHSVADGKGEIFYDHLEIIKYYALGNFKEFAKKMTLDNQMLRYLDNRYNTKNAPNENYAREFLELFTIGRGETAGNGDYTNYTEDDIVEAAKVFTGFSTANREEQYRDADHGTYAGRARFYNHEAADKQFSHRFNDQVITGASDEDDMYRELDDFVDMVFNQRATAVRFVTRLYQFFVRNNISAETESQVIQPLADTFINNDFEIKPVVEQLLKSQHFYDFDDADSTDEIVGGIIKSPIETLAHAMSFFKMPVPDPQNDTENHYKVFWHQFVIRTYFENCGTYLFAPDSVAGYPAYYQEPQYDETWFISSTMIPRYKLGEMLVTGRRVLNYGDIGGTKIDSVAYVEDPNHVSDPSDAATVVDEIIDYLFPEIADSDRRSYILNDIFLEGLSPLNWYYEWLDYESTGIDDDVRIPLDALIISIMRLPEYHLL